MKSRSIAALDRNREGAYVLGWHPRIRCWIDRRRDVHVAGEPSGFETVLDTLRIVYRGLRRRASAPLVTRPIPSGRNPVRTGVVQMFSRLVVESRRSSSPDIMVVYAAGHVVIRCTKAGMRELYVATCEAQDGEAALFRRCRVRNENSEISDGRIWFWGYSARNSF